MNSGGAAGNGDCMGGIHTPFLFGVWCLVFGVWCLVFGVWCLVRSVWCVVFGVWVFGVWCLGSRFSGFGFRVRGLLSVFGFVFWVRVSCLGLRVQQRGREGESLYRTRAASHRASRPREGDLGVAATIRWSTTLSSKVNLPNVIKMRALCGAILDTQRSET